jgi:two-component system, LuxR family, response regulator FixJ
MNAHVYIVDDDDRFRDSLCALIASVGLHAEGWSDPETLLGRPLLDRPGCVVLDYRLPSLSGLEVLRILRRMSFIPTILISAYADVQTAVAAMELGAVTVLEKPIDDNIFLNRLEHYCFEDQRWVLRRRGCEAIQKKLDQLTDTERAVLDEMRQGHSNKVIARTMGKSIKAVERQRQNIVHKLDCISAMDVLRKVQCCPMQAHSPLACARSRCPVSSS